MYKYDLGYVNNRDWGILLSKYNEGKVYLAEQLDVHHQDNNILVLKEGHLQNCRYGAFILPNDNDIDFSELDKNKLYDDIFLIDFYNIWNEDGIVNLVYQHYLEIKLLSVGFLFVDQELDDTLPEEFAKSKLLKEMI